MAEVECRSSSVKEVMQGYKDPCLSLSAVASLAVLYRGDLPIRATLYAKE
jgi:hypothetical protein